MSALQFPAHKCGLYLTHNEHRDTYEPVQDWIEAKEQLLGSDLFPTADGRRRAIATDEVWVLQWYPNTPIGFNIVAAPTLDEVMALATAGYSEERGVHS